MKKIILPLVLSLVIILALVWVAFLQKNPTSPAPTGTSAVSDQPKVPSLANGKTPDEDETDKIPFPEPVSSKTATGSATGSLNAQASGLHDRDEDFWRRSASSGAVATESTGAVAPTGENEFCTDEYDPVCGEDGQTYPNPCAAKRMKVSSKPGACGKTSGSESNENTGGTDIRQSPSSVSGSLSSSGAAVIGEYRNDSVGYGFILPRKSYFAGFWARDGATHSVGVNKIAAPDSFESSEVKIRFYKNQLLPELENAENGVYEDPRSGISYVSLSGSTLTIEGDRAASSEIFDSVIKTAHVR